MNHPIAEFAEKGCGKRHEPQRTQRSTKESLVERCCESFNRRVRRERPHRTQRKAWTTKDIKVHIRRALADMKAFNR